MNQTDQIGQRVQQLQQVRLQPPPVASSLAIRHWGGGWLPAVKKVEVGSEPFGTGVATHRSP